MPITPRFTAAAILEDLANTSDEDVRVACDTALKDAYWKRRNLHHVLAIGYSSIGRLLAVAKSASTPEGEHDALSGVKATLYNIASFTWPGWDEQGIDVSPTEAAAGLDAAKGNLAYAEFLDKGDLAISRAHWMVGAHELTAGMYDDAAISFASAAEAAQRAGSEPDAALSTSFGLLSKVASGDATAEGPLAESLDHLRTLADGEMFADQVITARRVIGC